MIKKVFQLKIVRYGVAAAIATVVDVSVYFLAYNYLFKKQDFYLLNFVTVGAPTVSLILSYSCGLITNFAITKYFVFTESDLRGHHQLMRYVMVAMLILFLNYGFMSFLIKTLEWFPTISRATSAIAIGFLSFAIHKVFSFKVSKEEN
ncbi:MAG: GtrA family protein [Bacteroidota bacterium]